MASVYHRPVLLTESIDALALTPDGTYVDATFGGGGHSRAILARLNGGRLVAFDQDPDAAAEAAKVSHRSFTFCPTNFRNLKAWLRLSSIDAVDGVLADLGISSHQIDTASRGFSTRFEGPLDMRMDFERGRTAADVLNGEGERELHRILGMYGELKNARSAAAAIVRYRSSHSLKTGSDLKSALEGLMPKGGASKYLAQVFQALRIEVNGELEALQEFLAQTPEVIRKGGRLVVISYHSLEDRMVKSFLSRGRVSGEGEKDLYGNLIRPFNPVYRKPIVPAEAEVNENPRARSAKLRAGERR
jgi:16S rRNA (cytosine1402-N4)-methyltransferase